LGYMKVAIDTAPLVSGHSNRGVGGYTKNLIEALRTYEPGHTYLLFNSKNQPTPQADCIHYPYFDPFFLTLPICSPKPTIVTVHDLIPIVFPKHFPKGIRGSIKWEIQKYSLQGKHRIITDSECSKKDIMKITGIPNGKIDVISLAPSVQKRAEKTNFESIRKQYGIEGDYFLYVGDVNWNKNIPALLSAFAKFLERETKNKEQRTLLLVGKAFLDTTLPQIREIDRLISDLKIRDSVVRTGYVQEDVLVSLYAHAQALIQPSLYEGFGFPVLDAMSLGCPVLCSDTSSLPEIAGPSIMVEPSDEVSMVNGMKQIYALSKEKRKVLIARGYDWVKQFSWNKVARETVKSYEKTVECSKQ